MTSKHLSDLANQLRDYARSHSHPTNLLIHLLTVPLFIVASAVLLNGLLQLSFVALVTGIIGLVAAVILQRAGHRFETDTPETMPDIKQLLREQFVTFPQFVLNGGWLRAWRASRHRQ
ncbi:Protein of unknown function [Pseudomonas cuatrocienegasensis]|uniref:Phage terminase, small subunit n=1 Tax=Pseudomonas cuatrocienegasensis TaxID=543360 RepID=A0ABY1B2T5_9PSED|nr:MULTISPECIES: Mpo1-like protein [Pseudomonas]OEC32682.1 hypothetical protein A7D25_22765 [Pseudomonas sp. 21C1]SEP77039.1 Protein of unknown function [Pseudomonas cuatrocienegasensis]